MATGREERMQQRMRGAQRHQVQQAASFDLLFGSLPLPPATDPVSTPTTAPSAVSSTQRQEEVAENPVDAPGSGRRRSVAVRAAARRSAALQQIMGSGGAGGDDGVEELDIDELSPPEQTATTQQPAAAAGGARSMFARLAHARRQQRFSGKDGGGEDTASALTDAAADDELSSPSFAIVSVGAPENASSSPLARKSTAGPGRPRTSRLSNLYNPNPNVSRPMRRSSRGVSVASSLGPVADETTPEEKTVRPQSDDLDELSPDQPGATSRPPSTQRASEVPSSSPVNRLSAQSAGRPSRGRPVATIEEENDDDEQAEEIDAVEAARTIGRKRPRRSTAREPSPELGSDLRKDEPAVTGDTNETTEKPDGPPAKRRRRKQQHLVEQSPSGQNQPGPSPKDRGKGKERAKAKAKAAPQPPKAKRRQRTSKKRARDEDSPDDEASGDDLQAPRKSATTTTTIPITVQRFVLPKRVRKKGASEEEEASDTENDDSDELAHAIPFSNRSGVNAADVLAQICHDIVAQKLQDEDEKRREAAAVAAVADDGGGGGTGVSAAAAAAAARRDALTRRAALEAFRQELHTRLLEQAVAVDTLHGLRQRVRAAHREKLALRDAILRVRAERDQVALRMDALRTRHQAATGRAMRQAALSAALHDIDLAVEQGRAAAQAGPPLTTAQQKTAELANLPLVASRVAEQVGSGGSSGSGTLQKMVAFNAFLARAAAVLEGRKRPRMLS